MTSTVVADGSAPLVLIHGEPLAQRATRVLVGWVNSQEALPCMLGRTPTPLDDLSGIRERIASSRAAVGARPPTSISDPVVPGDRTILDQVAVRPEVRANFPDAPWRVEWVDLTKVLSIQKAITTDGLDLRVAAAQDSASALIELCLPTEQPMPPLGAFRDHDGHGFTITSLNPNLRVAGAQVAEAQVALGPELPARRMQALTFLVNLGSSYVQVAHYRGRYFLRDGYHRAAGLLRAGVTHVPAIVLEAPSFEWVTPLPGLFSHEVAFGDRAPLLTDFWDDTVAADAFQPAARKVVRVRAEEFLVQG